MLSFLNSNSGAIGVIFSGLVTLATVVYALLTWRLVSETIRTRKAQTNPSISAGIETSSANFHALDLFVRNDGPGPAYDVSFEVEMEHPGRGDVDLLAQVQKLGFVSEGIRYLAPRQELRSFLDTSFNNFELKMETVLRVRTRFRTPDGDWESDSFLIDLSVLRNISQLGTPPLEEIAKSVQTLQKDVHRLLTGRDKPRVITQDKTDFEREQRQQRLQWIERSELDRLEKQGVEDGT